MGIPIAVVLTGANVHDSLTAIFYGKLTERNVTHLYFLMDAACGTPEIRIYIGGKGKVAFTDYNKY